MTTSDRVFLIGYRGSGKTTVGRLLADRLGWRFVDADDELEAKSGRTVADVFAAEGESAFRSLEADLLRELVTRERHVLACGGGVILRDENRRILRAGGYCVWLTGDPTTLIRRLAADPTTAIRRPALTDLPAAAEVQRLLAEREPLYREVAHCVVATDGRCPEDVVSSILSAWPTSPTSCP